MQTFSVCRRGKLKVNFPFSVPELTGKCEGVAFDLRQLAVRFPLFEGPSCDLEQVPVVLALRIFFEVWLEVSH